jgi:hypothetical protein
MDFPASWRALGRLAGWVLPILAGLLLAPADARASCGDYVTTRALHADLAPSSEHQPAAPEPRKPCPGPHCSQAPAAPLAPAPTAPPQTSQERACCPDALAPAPINPAAVLDEQQPRHPIRLPSDIFHPPRLAA